MSLYSQFKLGSGGVATIYAGTGTAVSSNTSVITVWNTGVLSINSSTEFVVDNNTGIVTPSVTSTLDNVVSRGNSTTSSIYAGALYDQGNRAVTSVTPIGDIGIGITDIISNGTATSFTIANYGVTDLTGSDYIGVSASTGSVTLTNLGVQTITAGTGTSLSASTGTVTVWNSASLQNVTDIGATTSNAIEITNNDVSTSTNTGALIVAGGVGIGGDLVVGGGIVVVQGIEVGESLTNSYTAPALLLGTEVNLDSFDVTKYRTAKYIVQAVDMGYTPNLIHSAEILVTHDANGDDTVGYIVQYGLVTNAGELGTWDSIYTTSTHRLILQFTPTYNPTELIVKVHRTVLSV